MEYNKLNIFYLTLTEKECFRLPLNFLSNGFRSRGARLPAGVWENEPVLRRKSPQTGIHKQWNTHLDKQTLGIKKKLI